MSATNTATVTAKVTPTVIAGAYPFAASQVAWQPANVSFGSGTAAGNVDGTYQVQLAPGTAGLSVQFNGGSLADPVGDTLSFARLDSLNITNTGTNSLLLSGALFITAYTAGASFQMKLDPGGSFSHTPGSASANAIVAGSGTSSVLTLTGISGATTVQVCAVGRSV